MTCSPTGRPSSGARPHGTEMAALPARSEGMVHRSARYIAIGSSARSPIEKAVVGVVISAGQGVGAEHDAALDLGAEAGRPGRRHDLVGTGVPVVSDPQAV